MTLTIDQLDLNPIAKKVATDLSAAFPSVIFTSGRRNLWGQAHAMATNVVAAGRHWILDTYLHAAPLQTWVDLHPDATDVETIASGLYHELMQMAPEDRNAISRHLSGDAFDVQPLVDQEELPTAEGTKVIAWIFSRRNDEKDVEKFLDHEGGICRWHVQCTASTEV